MSKKIIPLSMEKKLLIGMREMVGFSTEKGNKIYGWNNSYSEYGQVSEDLLKTSPSRIFISGAEGLEERFIDPSIGLTSSRLERALGIKTVERGVSKSLFGKLLSKASSGALVYNTAYDAYYGASQYNSLAGKLWGASSMLVASWVSSSILSGAVAEGSLSTAGYLGANILAQVGSVAGGPLGYIGGAQLGTWAFGAGAATTSTIAGVALPFVGAAAALTVGSYYALKGSHALLQAGYNYRQSQMRNINTAGSTAAFMNRNAFTMRSRAMEAMGNTNNNIKGAFGYEAQRSSFNAYRKLRPTMY